MIISRKKFNEAIEKAVREAEDRRWQYERMGNIERELNVRMDRISDRMYAIERHLELNTSEKKECGKCVSPSYTV